MQGPSRTVSSWKLRRKLRDATTRKFTAPGLITAERDCSAFSCPHDALTEWLQKRALANRAGGASKTATRRAHRLLTSNVEHSIGDGMKILLWIIAIIFVIGLLTVFGVGSLIF